MKINRSSPAGLLALVVMLLFAPFSQANTSSDQEASMKEVKKEAADLAQSLKSYTAEQRDKAVEKSGEALGSLDKKLEALEEKIDKSWEKMDMTARQKARTGMKELRKQRNKAAEWYGSMKNSSADAWNNMKEGFSDAYQELYDAWKKSEKEFSSDR
jgi:Sec-independent protein translocase protein TatA